MPKIPQEQQSPYGLTVAEGPRRRQRLTNIAHRREDRDDSDDGGNDDDESEPGTIWRFRDLKRKKIVGNWTTLLSWIANENFPAGIMIGPNSRGWFATDVLSWLRSRPVAGAAKDDHAGT